MKMYSKEFQPKHMIIRFCKLTFFIFLLVSGEKSSAQLSRIAVINLLDSNLIYKHIGFTQFKNKSDTFDCRFNCKKYIDQELTRILSSRYSVSLVSIPASLISPNGSIYTSSEIKKEARLWIAGLKNMYDFVIIVEADEQDDIMDQTHQKIQSSGLYSRGNPVKSWVAVYTTTRFILIRASNQENLDYGWSGMDYLLPLKDYKFSRENLLIDPEMLLLIRTGLVKLFDYKLQYFLTNSFLMPDGDYDSLKLLKTE
jgi:hypothetical protein